MSEKKFKESDVVINTQNGKEYYITRIEKVYVWGTERNVY